jgi:2-polyprenyl-3-methyl-5-hydroxy-6-metoxy-1,4-benzoquinol methylase
VGELRYFPFEEERTDIKDRVREYWTDRAESFYTIRHDEIESNKAERWVNEIRKALDAATLLKDADGRDRKLKVLDLGCGAGFFEVLLGRLGHDVTGIDLTEEMIAKAEADDFLLSSRQRFGTGS